jgi:hypothetical protein
MERTVYDKGQNQHKIKVSDYDYISASIHVYRARWKHYCITNIQGMNNGTLLSTRHKITLVRVFYCLQKPAIYTTHAIHSAV